MENSSNKLCSGDSFYVENFLNSNDTKNIYLKIIEEVTYIPRDQFIFNIFGKALQLPRDKQFYGDVDSDGSFPLYRYGGDYMPIVQEWTPTLKYLRDEVTKQTGQYCNHAVINRYVNGNDHIGYHHDKVKDFTDGTSVCTISLGKNKISLPNTSTNEIIVIVLKSELFILGPK